MITPIKAIKKSRVIEGEETTEKSDPIPEKKESNQEADNNQTEDSKK